MGSAAGIAEVLQSAIEQLDPHPGTSSAEGMASSVADVMAVVATTNYSLAQLPGGMGVSGDITLLIGRWVAAVHHALTAIVDACEGATFTIGVAAPLTVTASVTIPRQPVTADVA